MNTLHKMFDGLSVACHHNFSQCFLEESLFPSNVRFVHPHIRTRWGHITTPLAALRGFSLLRKHDRPDWFVLLSGSDYPVRPAEKIIAELSNSSWDVYLDNREILYRTIPATQSATDGGFGRPDWMRFAYDRYCALRFWWPRFSKSKLLGAALPVAKSHFFVRNPSIARRFQPDRPPRIYGGQFWFMANRRAIDCLLDNPVLPTTVNFYRRRPIPEESIFHTLLCSQPHLQICKDSKRYEDWTLGDLHPKWLEMSDVRKILASGAYFARKFKPDGVTQKYIDQTVLGI